MWRSCVKLTHLAWFFTVSQFDSELVKVSPQGERAED
jgi:hypothetical protein